ncbi:uncharacterized mitochondrial protein AtMg00810-like [Benincasa hispida]|uniref:uncharacterized mitochondrial protein AtMg00810-like n=1 Tax=Benincasa hispida TaxID=102211 RepID=UPI0019008167|nr:uncharacterized mitochondrial protein AtMg00810-like [Benincasa hispida]
MVGELTYFVGFQIQQLKDCIFISQSKYAKALANKFGLENARAKRTPALIHVKLSRDSNGATDESSYQSIIESLLYHTTSRPDIAFIVGVCTRYQAKQKASHLLGAKRITKYISGTYEYGLLYSFDTNNSLVGYCDTDWAESSEDRKSASGSCFFLGNNPLSWFSKKQNCIFLSTTEAKYVVVGSSCTQLL